MYQMMAGFLVESNILNISLEFRSCLMIYDMFELKRKKRYT